MGEAPSEQRHLPICIVGAGFTGVGFAIRLQQEGIGDFTILERAGELGGTWRDNTYPGCACDVPACLYSYSFAPNPDWSHAFGGQEEILAYLRAVAAEYRVERFIRYGVEVLGAHWDEDGRHWRLETSEGPMTASVLISATGPFGDPITPDIPGLERFEGTRFHSWAWNHDHDLSGERVAVIGTGASAVQFIPKIQPQVERLLVFQRTPPWVMPRMDRRISPTEQRLYRRFPALQRALRGGTYTMIESLGLVIFFDQRFRRAFEGIGRRHLRRQVPDPELRAKLTPDYAIGCKRTCVSDTYLPALTRDNVEVITESILEVHEGSVLTADGVEHEADTLILGTGFDVPSRGAERIVGRDGHNIIELYDKRPRSYMGTTLAGFPNLFMTFGPFSAAGNQSALFMLECQIHYIVDALKTMRRRGAEVVEVRPEAQEAFVSEVEEKSRDTVWLTGGCRSYYQTPDGRNAGLWPGWSFQYRRRTRRFDVEAHELT